MKKTLLLAIAPFLLASMPSQAAFSFTDNFNSAFSGYTVNGSSGQVTYGTTAGVGGSGGLVITNTGNPSTSIIPGAATNNTALKLGAGETITMSMMLKYSGSLGGTSQGFLGLSNGQDYSWGQNTIGNTTAVGGAIVSGVNLVNRGGTNGASSNTGIVPALSNASLTGGNWYLYQVSLTKPASTSSNIWTVSGFLQDYGLSGISVGATALTYTGATNAFGSTANTGINDNAITDTFLNFGVRNQMWTAADNFSATVVPEPSTWLGAGLLTCLAAWSQRKRLASCIRYKATSAT